jgi:hypothetical protein
LYGDRRILEHAPRHFHDPAAAVAPDVLMVLVRQLVMHLAIADVDALDQAFSFQS